MRDLRRTEYPRPLAAAEALRAGDFPELGRLMYASHASMRDDFEISTPELDGFVELAEAAGALADCRRFYAEEGFPDAWREHHQGGITGYASREVVATPETRQRIETGQAFAWNPSLPGAKAEETFVLTVNGPETITSL